MASILQLGYDWHLYKECLLQHGLCYAIDIMHHGVISPENIMLFLIARL